MTSSSTQRLTLAVRRAVSSRHCVTAAIIGLGTVTAAASTDTSVFPAEIQLNTNGEDTIAIKGDFYSETRGASAGDVNGDGLADIVMSSSGYDPEAPGIYVVFGRPEWSDNTSFFLKELLPEHGGDGSEGFRIEISCCRFLEDGYTAGDVNGDGLVDIAVIDPNADPDGRVDAGRVYIVYGRTTGFPVAFDPQTLLAANGGDGSEGFVINGIEPGDGCCIVRAAGDVNGDGHPDFVLGAPDADPPGRTDAGEVYVILGGDAAYPAEFELSSLLAAQGGDGSDGFVLWGPTASDGCCSVHGAGDVNDDGLDDLVLGDGDADPPGGRTDAGAAYLFFGRATFAPEFDLALLRIDHGGNGSRGVIFNGIAAGDHAGSSNSAGRINGDGVDDFVIGAPDNGSGDRGQAYLVFGSAEGWPAEFELSALLAANGGDGSAGTVLYEDDGCCKHIGGSVAPGGDLNDDGHDDLLIGGGVDQNNGGAIVIFGRSTPFPAEFNMYDLFAENGGDGSEGVVLRPGIEGTGTPLASGDINGDGVDDALIGAGGGYDDHIFFQGLAYLVFGRSPTLDSDGDGVPDITDNCADLPNTDQADSDGDTFGDACDNCPLTANEDQDDDDDDLLGDVCDNCTLSINADQRDTDADGFGNACDADFDNSCRVNFADLGLMKANFFGTDAETDLTGDGVVTFADLGILKKGFFQPPGPSGVPNACD